MKDSTENEVLKMIKIISDSTCDLSQEVLERYDIDIIPLHIVKGDEELEDGPQIDIHALYECPQHSNGVHPCRFSGLHVSIRVSHIHALRRLHL